MNIGFLLMEFCLVPERQLAASGLRKTMDKMQQAVEYIETNCRSSLTLPDVAAQMGMAPTYFSRKFRSLTGITFHEFLTRCRLKRAMDDLNHTDLNVTEIAFQNGFPNVKAFISTFKRCYQTTPKQYKASHFQG